MIGAWYNNSVINDESTYLQIFLPTVVALGIYAGIYLELGIPNLFHVSV